MKVVPSVFNIWVLHLRVMVGKVKISMSMVSWTVEHDWVTGVEDINKRLVLLLNSVYE